MENINNRRSLKEILPKKIENNMAKITVNRANLEEPTQPIRNNRENILGRKRQLRPKLLIWIIAVASAIFLFIIISTSFAQATINIVPKQVKVNLNEKEFTAEKNAVAGGLEFGVVSNEISSSAKIEATGVENVSQKATGTITVFNEFSEDPERLIPNTRFESPDGKIYRISQAISVPGFKREGGNIVPGSIDVSVTADEAGDTYNVGLVEFTVPGLKGDPRFDKVYAKSKTQISGGIIGEVKKVSEADEDRARESLRSELESRQQELKDLQIPEGFILFDEAIFYSFESQPVASVGENLSENEALVTEKMLYSGLLFNKEDLSEFIASRFIPDYDGSPVMINNLDEITFSLLNKESIENPNSLSQIEFVINGNVHLVWQTDTETVKTAIQGLTGPEIKEALGTYTSISRSSYHFRPFWIKKVPNNNDKIEIKYEIDK